jgi:hypothetical protein
MGHDEDAGISLAHRDPTANLSAGSPEEPADGERGNYLGNQPVSARDYLRNPPVSGSGYLGNQAT